MPGSPAPAPSTSANTNGRQARGWGDSSGQPGDLYASNLRELLTKVRDIPRIISRLQNRLRNPRELGGARGDTLAQIPRNHARAFDLLDSHLVGQPAVDAPQPMSARRLTDQPELA